MTNTISTYLKFANLQMAAEALYGFDPKNPDETIVPGGTQSYSTIRSSFLTAGNNRSSKFTETQAAQFVADGWTVVEHKSNTETGFSGTLFKYTGQTDAARGLTNGELVLSFRSTEFIDDAARDNQATNAMEIKPFGWAFGQIADMESWYTSLKSSGKLALGQNFAVTGANSPAAAPARQRCPATRSKKS